MQRRILSFLVIGFLFVSLFNVGCNKLDASDIGGDILPSVDNLHTFADTLQINTTQGVFSPDTTVVLRTEDHAVGHMFDPLYSENTTAAAYFQLKPAYFPYAIGNPGDTISPFGGATGFDSAVLCIKLKGYYGDTALPLQLDVREVLDNNFRDNVNQANNVSSSFTLGNVLGTTTINSISSILNDTVHYVNNKDYSVGVIRIKMNQLWGSTLFKQDSFSFHTGINAFTSDSIYRRSYNGLALVPHNGGTGNSLIYVNLADATTRLELHYRRQNNGSLDTVFNSMILNSDFIGTPTYRSSNTANSIQRNRGIGLPTGDQEIYLETNPGTFASLKIPGLAGLSNRIVHRAELIVEQIPDPSQAIFRAPNYLYLDLKDSGSTTKYKPIYFDLNTATTYDPDYKNPFSVPYFPSSGIDYLYYGGFRKDMTDKFGNVVGAYNFNITKYVQDIVTNHKTSYDMRLFSPFSFSYPQYSGTVYPYGNSIAYGRAKVGGGNNPNYKMLLRIVYTTL